jgi:hypothetical protein
MPSVAPRISLANFDARRDQIIKELMDAATDVGFFALVDHGIPSDLINDAFNLSEEFFGLPDQIKAKTPHNGKNCGWEKQAQVRLTSYVHLCDIKGYNCSAGCGDVHRWPSIVGVGSKSCRMSSFGARPGSNNAASSSVDIWSCSRPSSLRSTSAGGGAGLKIVCVDHAAQGTDPMRADPPPFLSGLHQAN